MKPTDAQISGAYAKAPKKVQELIEDGVLAKMISDMAKRSLFSQEQRTEVGLTLRNALLGLVSPKQTELVLVELGIKKEAIDTIISEAKTKLFSLVETSAIQPASSSPVPPDHLLPPHIESKAPNIPVRDAQPAVRQTPAQQKPIEPILSAPPKPRPIPPTPPQEPVRPRTMASDVEAMQGDGKKPHAPAPVPKAPPPPVMPQPVPSAQPPVPSQAKVHEDLKNYGVDPYREPIE